MIQHGEKKSFVTQVQMVTPEGVPLCFEIASVIDRYLAFCIDLIIIGVVALCGLLLMRFDGASGTIVVLLVLFCARNGYFIFFEHRWRGSTPGKRLRGLRVVDATGGQLEMESVVVRNLTREAELMLPLTIVVAPEFFWPAAPPWVRFMALTWPILFGCIIFLNRYKRRFGDLIAGTLVVRSPLVKLLADLAEPQTSTTSASQSSVEEPYVFRPEHLAAYGEYELNVLDDILRRRESPDTADLRKRVCDRIIAKIGWEGAIRDTETFLKAYYTAQREYLEQKMLLGKRRKDKKDRL